MKFASLLDNRGISGVDVRQELLDLFLEILKRGVGRE